jgi:hypothetical protein
MSDIEQEDDRTRHQQEARTAYESAIGPDGAMRRDDEREYPYKDDANPGVDAPFPTDYVLGFRRGAVV